MARNLLTIKAVAAAAPAEREYLLADGDGLFLRIRPTGHRSWLYVYSLPKQTKYGLGTYPTITLARARELTEAARQLVAAGVHPAEDDRRRADEATAAAAEAAAINAPTTVDGLFARWDEGHLSTHHKDCGAHVRGLFANYTAPIIGAIPLMQLRPRHIAEVLDRAKARGVTRTCGVLLGHIKQMCDYGVQREWLQGNPASSYSAAHWGGESVERERYLSDSEVTELVQALSRSRFSARWQAAIWLILATGTRVGETLLARPEHINLDRAQWLIPAENQKKTNRKTAPQDHWIDLSPFAARHAARLLDLAGPAAAWVFPGRGGQGATDEKTLTKAVKDRQRDTPLKGRTTAINDLVLSGGLWTPHDLRRTTSTLMGELDVPPDVINRCQNHTVGDKITRTYQRQKKAGAMKAAWLLLGERLAELTAAAQEKPHPETLDGSVTIHPEQSI